MTERVDVDELFERLMSAESGPTPRLLDELCAAHPEQAAELRELVARWGGLAGALHGEFAGLAQAEELERIPRDAERDRYELLAELGRGGMGVVHRARDKRLLREVALKVLRVEDGAPGATLPARKLARFLEEARVASRLGHPGIAPVHELGRDEQGRVYFTMPLVEGEDFERVLERLRAREPNWNATRALGVLQRVAEAVAFAHSRGVLHRDLKPANVMVGRFGETYVMDWGLARVREPRATPQDLSVGAHLTLEGDVMGTPAYMSPEQAAGKLAELDARADVYALGAMLYHLLALRMPYARDGERPSARDVLERVRAGPPAPLSRLRPAPPAELVAICERAMARAPEQRYATMEALASDLRAFLEGRVVAAYESGPWAEWKKWVLRNKRVAALAALALGVALAGLVAVLVVQTIARAKVESLSDHQLLSELELEAQALWPAVPARLPALDDWLRRAREVGARLALHEQRLTELDARAAALGERERDASAAFRAEHLWTFDDATARWQHDKLVELVHGLRTFVARDGVANRLAEVEARRANAATIEERSTSGPAARAAWEKARSEIAADPRYGGLVLGPQLGLFPIGRDPQSGLYEFAHVDSGAIPRRNALGLLDYAPDSAIVLVLIPGVRFAMGAVTPAAWTPDPCREPGAFNVDPEAAANERPVHEIELAPYFIAKYELTRVQWARLAAGDPRFQQVRTIDSAAAAAASLPIELVPLMPIEAPSWTDADTVLRNHGLALPSEAQWECAARAGASTPWWWGVQPLEELRPVERLKDPREPIYESRSPVGAWQPNPYGLYDIGGNVAEWCADRYDKNDYALPVEPVTGRRSGTAASPMCVFRGGSSILEPRYARSSMRFNALADQRVDFLGVRAARLLE